MAGRKENGYANDPLKQTQQARSHQIIERYASKSFNIWAGPVYVYIFSVDFFQLLYQFFI